MIDVWKDWKTDPPPIISCHVRQGCFSSVPLVVIDDLDQIYDDVTRGDDGLCHCFEGGRIANVVKWTYAPSAWNGVFIDKAEIEIELIRLLQKNGYLPAGDPEVIVNDLYDPPFTKEG